MGSMALKQYWSEIRQYPRDVVDEVKKITWPTRERTVRMTLVVFAVVGVSTALVGGVDYLFNQAIQLVINR